MPNPALLLGRRCCGGGAWSRLFARPAVRRGGAPGETGSASRGYNCRGSEPPRPHPSRRRDAGAGPVAPRRERATLLVLGASRAARRVNEAALGAYDRWRKEDRLQVLHLVGPKQLPSAQARLAEVRGGDDG